VNHFSTIGIVGMNEACLNLLGKDIGSEKGLRFSLAVMDFIRETISDLQEQTGDIFNLEATPAEGTSYRLAMLDKKEFPEILCANEDQSQIKRDVGVNGNYLSHPSHSVTSSGLPIRFTDAVVISGNRATDAPVYPNFRTVSLVLTWPQFTPLLTPCQVLCLFLFLFAPTSPTA
jgi:anaerobic ribonucleoside-triphosphate reductase